MSDRQNLLNKLVEFDNSLPQIIDDCKLRYQGRIEPLRPFDLVELMHAGLMVPISRAALREIISILATCND